MNEELTHDTWCTNCGKGISAEADDNYRNWVEDEAHAIICSDCKWKPVVTYDYDFDDEEDEDGTVLRQCSVDLLFDGVTVKCVGTGEHEKTYCDRYTKQFITDELTSELYDKLADYEKECDLEAIKLTVDNFMARYQNAKGFLFHWPRNFGNEVSIYAYEDEDLAERLSNQWHGPNESSEIATHEEVKERLLNSLNLEYAYRKTQRNDQIGGTHIDGWLEAVATTLGKDQAVMGPLAHGTQRDSAARIFDMFPHETKRVDF